MKNGHLLYMASGGYGKTMLLTQIILGLSMKNAVKNLNFYLIDLGNSALIPLRGFPTWRITWAWMIRRSWRSFKS